MTSEMPKLGLPLWCHRSRMQNTRPHFGRHDHRPSIAATRKGFPFKNIPLAPLALSEKSMRPPNPSYQKVAKASKMTPLRNECFVVTTGIAKPSLAALRAQTDHPLDQPVLAEAVFIFDLFGLCCGLCVALSSQLRYPFNLLFAELSVSHFFLPNIRMRQNRRAS
jgi:hypothetical protein